MAKALRDGRASCRTQTSSRLVTHVKQAAKVVVVSVVTDAPGGVSSAGKCARGANRQVAFKRDPHMNLFIPG